MFKTAIMIPVFVYTEQEIELSKLDLTDENNGFEETEFRAFWIIESAFPDERDGKQMTGFFSGSNSFYSPIEFQRFIKLINNHINK